VLKMDETNMMHGMHYSGQDVTAWIATEKLDGVRAYWDGATMWTRGGNAISIPDHWRETLPVGIHLDGELFAGYGQRQKAVNAARYGRWDDAVRFVAFDAPKSSGVWQTRMIVCQESCVPHIIKIVWSSFIYGISHAEKLRDMIKADGGEGLMLRHPELEYHPGRTDRMLKLK
jgi:DNA ligase 1